MRLLSGLFAAVHTLIFCALAAWAVVLVSAGRLVEATWTAGGGLFSLELAVLWSLVVAFVYRANRSEDALSEIAAAAQRQFSLLQELSERQTAIHRDAVVHDALVDALSPPPGRPKTSEFAAAATA